MASHSVLSRRDLLKALGIGTASVAVGARLSGFGIAQAQEASVGPSAFYTTSIGDLQFTVI